MNTLINVGLAFIHNFVLCTGGTEEEEECGQSSDQVDH